MLLFGDVGRQSLVIAPALGDTDTGGVLLVYAAAGGMDRRSRAVSGTQLTFNGQYGADGHQ
jgi:hypothetical protein